MDNRRSNRLRRRPLNKAASIAKEETHQTTLLQEMRDLALINTKGYAPRVRDAIPIRIRRDKVYTFCRTAPLTGITPVTGVDTTVAYSLSLSDIGGSDFVNLFDNYRIVQVTFLIEPTLPVSGTIAPAPIYTVIDKDDASSVGSIAAMMQYDTFQSSSWTETISRTFKPNVSLAAYSGAFTSFTASSSDTWIDSASASVAYYGLKIYVPAFTFSGAYALRVSATAVVQCRHPN